jgi:hypothetical protein
MNKRQLDSIIRMYQERKRMNVQEPKRSTRAQLIPIKLRVYINLTDESNINITFFDAIIDDK